MMAQRHAFDRSWGADLLGDGSARFRIWAPSQTHMALRVGEAGSSIPMHAGSDGWFELVTDKVPVNGTYAFRLTGGTCVPDPAARAQAGSVHGPSLLIDPSTYEWQIDWQGRPWHEAIIYEIHTGTFSPEGTFNGIESRLDQRLDETACGEVDGNGDSGRQRAGAPEQVSLELERRRKVDFEEVGVDMHPVRPCVEAGPEQHDLNSA